MEFPLIKSLKLIFEEVLGSYGFLIELPLLGFPLELFTKGVRGVTGE
jgi:hypothetical protein